MTDDKKNPKGHVYHAFANAFDGHLERPIEERLPVLATSALHAGGGYSSARNNGFSFHEFLSIAGAFTHVGGSVDRETGNPTTIATSVLKGLNVGHVLYADRIVAQISLEHPADGGHPRVSFVGTHFDGLRVGGCEIKPVLNLDVCNCDLGFPKKSHLENADLVKAAQEQSKTFAKFWLTQKGPAGKLLRGMAHLNKDGENTKGDIERRGSVLCSLVDKIEGKCAGTVYGHAINIPDFGRVFLAELKVEHGGFDLTMLRLDLGSPFAGQATGAQAAAGGGKGGPVGPKTGP